MFSWPLNCDDSHMHLLRFSWVIPWSAMGLVSNMRLWAIHAPYEAPGGSSVAANTYGRSFPVAVACQRPEAPYCSLKHSEWI